MKKIIILSLLGLTVASLSACTVQKKQLPPKKEVITTIDSSKVYHDYSPEQSLDKEIKPDETIPEVISPE